MRLLPLWKGSPGRDDARLEYNSLLKIARFYEEFAAEYLCIFQTDCYFRKQIPDAIFNYDYIAAPFEWDETSAGGGLSFRKRDSMIDICRNFKQNIESEDCYICEGIKMLGYKMPYFLEGISFIAESCIYEDPIGVHQWWTFFNTDIQEPEYFFKSLLTLDAYL